MQLQIQDTHAKHSTSVGTLEFRCITEPVRTYSKETNFYQAFCDKIDVEKQVIHCTSNIDAGTLKLAEAVSGNAY